MATSEEFNHLVGHQVRWVRDDREHLIYHYATDQHKPFIHPLCTPGGHILTVCEPHDHPWHRGVWFAWKYLNGVNFWEEPDHAGHNMSNYRDTEYGTTQLAGVDAVVWRTGKTRIRTHYTYCLPDGGVLLTEQRTVDISAMENGYTTIDWDATFTAQAQVVRFDRTVIAPETPWGGYAGMSFRAAQSWRDVQGLDSEGRRNLEIEHQRARWVGISGVTDTGNRVSLTILDHPGNPRYPSYWRYIADPGFSYINPSLVLAEPYDLSPGASFRVRYRLLAADGAMDGAKLELAHEAFRDER